MTYLIYLGLLGGVVALLTVAGVAVTRTERVRHALAASVEQAVWDILESDRDVQRRRLAATLLRDGSIAFDQEWALRRLAREKDWRVMVALAETILVRGRNVNVRVDEILEKGESATEEEGEKEEIRNVRKAASG